MFASNSPGSGLHQGSCFAPSGPNKTNGSHCKSQQRNHKCNMIRRWFRTLPPDFIAKHGSAQDTGMQGTGPPGQIIPGKIMCAWTNLPPWGQCQGVHVGHWRHCIYIFFLKRHFLWVLEFSQTQPCLPNTQNFYLINPMHVFRDSLVSWLKTSHPRLITNCGRVFMTTLSIIWAWCQIANKSLFVQNVWLTSVGLFTWEEVCRIRTKAWKQGHLFPLPTLPLSLGSNNQYMLSFSLLQHSP